MRRSFYLLVIALLLLTSLGVLPTACLKNHPIYPINTPSLTSIPTATQSSTPTITSTTPTITSTATNTAVPTCTYSYVTQWGGFMNPSQVVFSLNKVWVADYGNNIIKYFTPAGAYLGGFMGNVTAPGWGNINGAAGVAITNNPFPLVYLSDSNNNRIQYEVDNGEYITWYQWGSYGSNNGQFEYPGSLVRDSHGNIFVADIGNYRVQEFTSIGGYITQWGMQGTGNSQFGNPFDLGIDSSNNIYVTDTGNNRVQKFDDSGNYLTQFGGYGSGNGQFNNPRGNVVDSSGNIFVCDYMNNRIEKFDSSMNFLCQFGTTGSGNGQFEYPNSVAVDGSGNLYILDSLNRVQVFSH